MPTIAPEQGVRIPAAPGVTLYLQDCGGPGGILETIAGAVAIYQLV